MTEIDFEKIKICPLHIAVAYRIFQKLTMFTQNLFLIPSGNTLGLLKHGGHLPWDDDVDLGFVFQDKQELVDFVNTVLGSTRLQCFANFGTNVFKKIEPGTELGDLVYFNFSLPLEIYQTIQQDFGCTTKYLWGCGNTIVPWVDVFLFTKDNEKLVSHKNITLDVSSKFLPRVLYDTIISKMPSDISEKLFENYPNCGCINEDIFGHINPTKVSLHVPNQLKLAEYISAYNQQVKNYLIKLQTCYF